MTQRDPHTITSESANPFLGPFEPSISENLSSSPLNGPNDPSGSESLFRDIECTLLFARYWTRVVAVCYGLSVLVQTIQWHGNLLGLHAGKSCLTRGIVLTGTVTLPNESCM